MQRFKVMYLWREKETYWLTTKPFCILSFERHIKFVMVLYHKYAHILYFVHKHFIKRANKSINKFIT
jgi:hypothetical protein